MSNQSQSQLEQQSNESLLGTIKNGFIKLLKPGVALPTVQNVGMNRYIGKWYEIVRMPFYFENGLEACTATYSKNQDGTIRVLNTGKVGSLLGQEKQSQGTAWSIDQSNSKLKVQFQWPFKGDYQIIDLDTNYKWALVGEPTRTYGWILARNQQLDESTVRKLVNKMRDLGYDTAKLHFDRQT